MNLTTPARVFVATVILAGTGVLMASLRTMILSPGVELVRLWPVSRSSPAPA